MSTETEDNWTRSQRMAREVDKDYLIQCLLVQIASMRKRNEKHIPLWSYVGSATSHGSGVSTAICNAYGVNSSTGEVVREIPRQPPPFDDSREAIYTRQEGE